MVIHRVLDETLRSWSHVAVLRALQDTATGYTGNQVARVSGMHPRSALKALTSLESLGIVRRQRGGRDHLFTLNRGHYLVEHGIVALFQVEGQFRQALVSALSGVVAKHVVSAVIFGSVARHEETPESDLDLACFVRSSRTKERVLSAISQSSLSMRQTFGIRIAPLVLSLDEVRKSARRQVVSLMMKESIHVCGKPVEKVVNAKTVRQKVH